MQSSTHRFRASIAMSVLASPPEYASATRLGPWISWAIPSSRRRTNASTCRDDDMRSRAERLVARDELRERLGELGLVQTNLLLRIPLPDRDPFSFERLVVHRHGERRADLVHASVPSTDRTRIVVERGKALPQAEVERLGPFRESVFVDEGKDADAHGREPRWESQDDPLALAVRKVQQGPHVAVHAKGQFEDMGNEPRSVEGDGLLRVRHGLVTLQVVVRPVVDAADLLEPAEALLFHLDVEVDLVVKRALLLIELRKAKCVSRDPEPLEIESLNRREVVDVPGWQIARDEILRENLVCAELVFLRGPGDANRVGCDRVERQPGFERRRVEEDLEFRLEEFAHAVRALARANFVPVRPPDNRESHRELPAQRLELPFEIQIHALGGLRPKVRAILSGRPDVEREHHVEGSRRPEFAFAVRATDFQLADSSVQLCGREPFVLFMGRRLEQLISAVRFAAARARDEEVREVVHVAGGLERRLREDRRRVDEVVVIAQSQERLGPEVFPPAAQEEAVVAVVVETRETSVQIDRGPQETAADGQRHHVVVGGHWRQKVAPQDKGWGGPRLFHRVERATPRRRPRIIDAFRTDGAGAGHDRPPETTSRTSLAEARTREANAFGPPGRSRMTRSARAPTRIPDRASESERRRPRSAISKISRAGTPPFIRATRYANSISRRRDGVLIIALSVPRRSSMPCPSMRGMSGVNPKNAFERGHTTIGTSASAHRSKSASVAWTMWTRNAGFRSRTVSTSSRTRSEQWIAKIFFARRTSAASFSIASRGQSMYELTAIPSDARRIAATSRGS